ncbi:DUF6220 domain-containing protein [Frigidibacter sp.]|uniref:DUF6220 domain-containing protein n=1 Tax=Frigidibacter sp. TaxID=2586418 RepID=UPI002734B83D|nr:DUF6220 domain-containing protein [Frigidibacter sp.]MDP3340829.1 DUF6220 domain-containing protein [Frigidibacter sp.]
MEKMHDTFTDLGRGTPVWFTLSARLLPLGLLAQFLSAGIALFRDGGMWGLHGAVGGALSLPVFALLGGALFLPRLRGFGWWAGLTALLYLAQIALAAGAGPLLALHPLNGALLLTASLTLLAKVERRRAQPLALDT